MKRYILDTNTVSYFIKGHPMITQRIVSTSPIASLCISAITAGELLFGLAKRPEAKHLHTAVRAFLRHVDVLPWDTTIADCYGDLRANMEQRGKILAPLDLLIAAHALKLDSVLVTNDLAFLQVTNLHVENWT